MKKVRLMFVHGTQRTGLCAVLSFALSLVFGATAATLNVPADYPTIQAAIDAAVNGDEVVVAPATYQENINFNGKAITVRSSDGAAVTTIAGGSGARAIYMQSGETSQTTLRGFTVTGTGVRIAWSTPRAEQCIFANNTYPTHNGGAMEVENASPLIEDCAFNDNMSGGSDGGGIVFWGSGQPVLRQCTFNRNRGSVAEGGRGGALFINDSNMLVSVEDCAFVNNVAPENGGAIYLRAHNPSVFIRCTFTSNTANYGGAVYTTDYSTPAFESCSYVSNSAANKGGAFFCSGGSSPSVTVADFSLNHADDDGGAICGTDVGTATNQCSKYIALC